MGLSFAYEIGSRLSFSHNLRTSSSSFCLAARLSAKRSTIRLPTALLLSSPIFDEDTVKLRCNLGLGSSNVVT